MRCLLLSMFLSATSLGAGEDPKSPTSGDEYNSLSKAYQDANTTWRESRGNLTPADPVYADYYAKWPIFTFASKFIKFAESHPGETHTADALLKVLENSRSGWIGDKSLFPHFVRARTLLIDGHLQDERVVQACLSPPIAGSRLMEEYYRALLAKGGDRDVLGRACMALLGCSDQRIRIATRPYFENLDDHPAYRKTTEFMTSRIDPDFVTYIKTADPVALSLESERLLDRVVNEFGDIPLSPKWSEPDPKGRTLADLAKPKLYALRGLAVGNVAPDIEGEDIDGKPMKLSEYRGKVVMLVFWGTWCGPCMGLVPHEKVLVERLKDRPFALLGINSDSDREKLKVATVEKGISWRSWWDGGSLSGPIANRWNVRGWPTIIILDKAGVIRFKGLPHHVMKPVDDAVDSLLEGLAP